MSISKSIREQLLSAFRAELAEHIQTMTDGLLALEQGRVSEEQHPESLTSIFRAAHSLKGAARAVGVTAIEQIAHSLEEVLDGLRRGQTPASADFFSTCYRAFDAIQAVQAAYEAGEITPPLASLQALADLGRFQPSPVQIGRDVTGVNAASHSGSTVQTDEQSISHEMSKFFERPDVHDTQATPVQPTANQAGLRHKTQEIEETLRVRVSKLDTLMNSVGELLLGKMRIDQRLDQVRELHAYLAEWQRMMQENEAAAALQGTSALKGNPLAQGLSALQDPNPTGSLAFGPVGPAAAGGNGAQGREVGRLAEFYLDSQQRLREVDARVTDLVRQLKNDSLQMSLSIEDLDIEIKRLRMLPLSTITGPFPRMVRDLANETGKEAALKIIGAETELDRQVLDQIKDPLIHLLRNAVDHGLETPDVRQERGKYRAGMVILKAEQVGKEVVISVTDDGSGLNLEALRQALTRQNATDSHPWSDAELVDAAFQAGISTRQVITDISGRGVGLNVVRRNVEAVQGRVEVHSRPGHGVTFTLTLPMRVTSSRGLLVRTSNQLFAIPLNNIERLLLVKPKEIHTLEGYPALRYNDRPLSLVRLDNVLELPHAAPPEQELIPIMVLISGGRRMAFMVDELAGEQEYVMRDLGPQILSIAGIAGATVRGSGEVLLILDVADLMQMASGLQPDPLFDMNRSASAVAVSRSQKRILVVDDSITTRTLEKNILEAAGYSVQVAIDGQEALTAIVSGGAPHLVITDIIMPRMDGLELTRRMKGDANLSHVPVILVSSLHSAEDKAQGVEAGADAYIIKGDFDQTTLLEMIEQLI